MHAQLLQLWTMALKAPLSMGFPRQEYWSGLPCLPPGDLPDLGIKPASLWSPALAGGFFTTSAPCVALVQKHVSLWKKKKKKIEENLRDKKGRRQRLD